MSLEEARVLAHDVHDVAGHDGLVVLAPLHLREAKEILNNGDQEALLRLFVHGERDGTDGPAEHVAVVPGPFRPVDLLGQLLRHDLLRVDDVEVRQVHEGLADGFVERDRVALLDELPNDLALVVLDDEHLLRPDHLLDHDDAEVGKDFGVLVLAKRVRREEGGVRGAGRRQAPHGQEGVRFGDGQDLHLVVELLYELDPVVQADLEDLAVVDLGNADQVEVAVREEVPVW